MDKTQLPSVIIGKLLNIGSMLQRHGNRLLLPYELNQQQFSIFFEIATAGKIKQKEMVNRLLLEKANVSKVVKKLEKMDLISIRETEDDKRSFWLMPTDKGLQTLKECMATFEEWNNEWMSALDEGQMRALLDPLTQIQNIFREKMK